MIDKNSKLPLYYQLIDIIVDDIEKEKLKEGDKIPSERELCEKYKLSRGTVRQAIQYLEKENHIYKEHGKGTFVSSRRISQDLTKIYSFVDEMKKLGKQPTTKVIDFEVILSDSKLSRKMEVDEGSEIYKVVRLRYADNEPMMIVESYLLKERFSNISIEDLRKKSMYRFLIDRYNLKLDRAYEDYQSVYTKEEEAVLLEVSKSSPGMLIERVSYERERIIEYTKSIARGDRFKYRVQLYN